MTSQFAGLVLAAIAAFVLSPVPPRTPFTTGCLILALAWYIPLPVFLAALTPVLLLRRRNSVRWPIAITAIWFAPRDVLGVGWTIPFLLWIIHLTAVTTAAPPVVHRLLSAAAALVFQFVVVLAAVEKFLLATLLSVFPIHLLCRGLSPFSTQRATLLSLPLALLLTWVGLSHHLIIPPTAPTPVPPVADNLPAEPKPLAPYDPTGNRGVILLPPRQKFTMIVPPVPSLARSFAISRPTQTLRIPFAGVYWLFQPPHSRPPQSSVTVRGIPTETTFRSNDARPLLMEARQHLGATIDLSCCAEIQIEADNADENSRYASFELIL